MSLTHETKQRIYGLLPAEYLESAKFLPGVEMEPEGDTDQQRVFWWANQDDAFLRLALSPDAIELDLKSIYELADITGTQLDPANDDYPEDQQKLVADFATRHVKQDQFRSVVNVLLRGKIDDSDFIAIAKPGNSLTDIINRFGPANFFDINESGLQVARHRTLMKAENAAEHKSYTVVANENGVITEVTVSNDAP